MNYWRALREAGTAVWVGGQLYGIAVLPTAGGVLARRRDRHRAIVKAWQAWTPMAFAALAAVAAGTIFDREAERRGLRVGSVILAVVSTGAATALGELLAGDLRDHGTVTRNESGIPVAHLAHRSALQAGMVPVNVAHALAAAGLVLADA